MTTVERRTTAALDGGWGWLVTFGAACCFFIVPGLTQASTFLYQEWLEYFQAGPTFTSWIFGINFCFRVFASPLASMLCEKYTCRCVGIAGGILNATGLLLSAYPPVKSIAYVLITYGFICGIGGCFSIGPAFIIIGEYFDRKKGKAMGFATAGISVGSFVFPYMLSKLFHDYTYSGALLIISAISLHQCVASSLFQPVQLPKKCRISQEEAPHIMSHDINQRHTSTQVEPSTHKRVTGQGHDMIEYDEEYGPPLPSTSDFLKHNSEEDLNLDCDRNWKPENDVESDSLNSLKQSRLRQNDRLNWNTGVFLNKKSQSNISHDRNDIVTTHFFPDDTHNTRGKKRNNLKQLAKNTRNVSNRESVGCPTNFVPMKNTASNDSIRATPSRSIHAGTYQRRPERDRFGHRCLRTCCVTFSVYAKLMKKSLFSLYCALVGVHALSYIIHIVYVSGYAKEIGLLNSPIAFQLSIQGGIDLLARISSGFIVDLNWVRRRRILVYPVSLSLLGICSGCLPLTKDYVSWAIVLVGITFWQAFSHAQFLTALGDLVDKGEVTTAVGLLRSCQGFGPLVVFPLGGLLVDVGGSYGYTYYFSSGLILSSTLLFMIVYSVMKLRNSDCRGNV